MSLCIIASTMLHARIVGSKIRSRCYQTHLVDLVLGQKSWDATRAVPVDVSECCLIQRV